MDHVLIVHVLEADDHTSHHKLCLLLVEPALFADVEAQITSIQQVRHQIQILVVLEGVIHIHEESTRL